MMDRIISHYEIKLVEAECAPGSARYGVKVTPDEDISPVFPYLNEVMPNARYDHDNQILILRESDQVYAFRQGEIRIARAGNWQQAQELADEIVEKLNRIWQERSSITPRFTERKSPTVIDIFKLLPQNNCRDCGYPTCLAFAADLRAGTAQIDQCPPLSDENRERILELFVTSDTG